MISAHAVSHVVDLSHPFKIIPIEEVFPVAKLDNVSDRHVVLHNAQYQHCKYVDKELTDETQDEHVKGQLKNSLI